MHESLRTPAALLRAAAQALEPQQPKWKQHFWFGGWRYLARFDWPGVVLVFDVSSGKIVAQSLPGRPMEPHE